MSGWTKATVAVAVFSMGVFLLLAISLATALATGLYVDHGQNLPGSFTIPGLVALGGLGVAGVMWLAEKVSHYL